MTSVSSSNDGAFASRNRLVLVAFTIAIFTSALLLFSIQPLFARMVLPRLGGSPAVWSVAMVFFQSMLLAGYAYAHWLMNARRAIVPVIIHLTLLVAAAFMLPLSIATGWGEPPARGMELWLIGLFCVSIGLPFFALAANNPLLQAWFVRTGHPAGDDPYFLYASSNIGSFLALLSYPILFEPLFTLRVQNLMWTGGYALLVVMIAACGVLMLKTNAAQAREGLVNAGEIEGLKDDEAQSPSRLLYLRWIFLSAVPSGLLVAVTAHISTDVAAAPLLWVLPLSLYLLTWVIVFQRRPLLPHKYLLILQPIAIAGIVVLFIKNDIRNLELTLGGNLLAFFIIAMMCHGELARTRPAAKYLTGFYVALSFGGMVGGLFAGLASPYLFSWIAEYPILLVLAVLCRPAGQTARAKDWLIWAALLIGAIVLTSPKLFNFDAPDAILDWRYVMIYALLTIAVLLAWLPQNYRWQAAAIFAFALILVRLYPADDGEIETVRSFFGVHKIMKADDGAYHVLLHGTTIHGAQKMRNADGSFVTGRPEPLSYYYKTGGMGQAVATVRAAKKDQSLRVAVIGLGAGSLACHIAANERWKFFEIDQSIIDIARDPERFSFVKNCAPDMQPVLGDARLTFAREADGAYDLIIVDAYSSDAIPVHLATKEAMAVYKAKLAPDGAIVMHVSNRHLELTSVVSGIADANGLQSWSFDDNMGRDDEYIFSTQVVLSAPAQSRVGMHLDSKAWNPIVPDKTQRVWTDDYSNILGAVWRKF